MTDEQRRQVDELIAGSTERLNDVWGFFQNWHQLRSIAKSNLAIALMLREMLDKPKEPEWHGMTPTVSHTPPAVTNPQCDPPQHYWIGKDATECYCGKFKVEGAEVT
jgi:hypothetical protein